MAERRSFLFLQGPVGPFFARLGAALRAGGHRVGRINLDGGDALQWRGEAAVSYRAGARGWAAFVRAFARRHDVRDLVLVGDCRPWHSIAMRALRPLGVRAHVFEEGYFRPDWITCERDGVNGHSRLPKDPQAYLAAASELPRRPPRHESVGPALRGLVRNAAAYYGGVALLNPSFPCHRTHRLCSPAAEAINWLRREDRVPGGGVGVRRPGSW